jgi:hypothetical protein
MSIKSKTKQQTASDPAVGSRDLLECVSMLEREADKCDHNAEVHLTGWVIREEEAAKCKEAAAKLRRWAKWIAYHAAL